MNRRTLGVAVVALCCIAAIVLGAGSLAETTDPGGDPGGPAPDPDSGSPSTATSTPMDADVDGGQNDKKPPVKTDRCESSVPPILLFGVVGIVAVTTAGMYRRYDGLVAVCSFFVVSVILVSVLPFLMVCPSQKIPEEQQNGTWEPIPSQNESSSGGEGEGSGEPGEDAREIPTSLLLLAGIAAVAVAVVAGVWVVRRDDEENDFEAVEATEMVEDDPVESADAAAVAAAAGRAADIIETETDLDNEIYRAWVEMTRHLPVDHPETSTPREFERAAIDAGIAPDDVRALTDLFEAVRYGHEDVTQADEDRAVEALRRVETQERGENE